MRRWNVVVGAVLVILGIFALLQVLLNVAGINFRIWWLFWPLVLIAGGVWIVLGIWRSGLPVAPAEQAQVPLEGAAEADVTVRHGAGRLSVAAGAGAGQLLSGTFGGGLDAARTLDGKRLKVDMRVKERDVSRWIFGPWGRGWGPGMLDWDFTLNPSVPLALRLETGASETRLSLGDLQVKELSLRTGASSTSVDLPAAAGFTRVTVRSGAAAIRIRVPQGVAASIAVRSALAGVRVDTARFPAAGSGYASPDYDRAANRVEISVETGVGSVDIS